MDIRVGDVVTYKCININKEDLEVEIIKDNIMLNNYKNRFESNFWELIKIERPNYLVIEKIEEKKELLTEDEREFLKLFIKFCDFETEYLIKEFDDIIYFYCSDGSCNNDLHIRDCNFKGLELNKNYTLSELRIGGINNYGVGES